MRAYVNASVSSARERGNIERRVVVVVVVAVVVVEASSAVWKNEI